MINKYALKTVWVVNNIGRGYVRETIKRKIHSHKDGDYIMYKNKQYKISYYQPVGRHNTGYTIFPLGLPKSLKGQHPKYWHKGIRLD